MLIDSIYILDYLVSKEKFELQRGILMGLWPSIRSEYLLNYINIYLLSVNI